MLDFLIIGQGIAGTALSRALLERGATLRVIDQDSPYTASHAASGMCNPITGRRLVKTWQAEALFPFLKTYYHALAQSLSADFWREMEIFRPFDNLRQYNDWQVKKDLPSWQAFIQAQTDLQAYAPYLDLPYEGWRTQQALHVNAPLLIAAYRQFLQSRGLWQAAHFRYEDLRLRPEGVIWQGITARRVVFCEGARVVRNPWFGHLPFRPDKGEWLLIEIPSAPPLSEAIKKGVFLIPVAPHRFLVSGTYQSREALHYLPTMTSRQYLSQELKKFLKMPFRILEQRAGLRGATKQRRPLMGLHPRFPALALFNGFGTKGLSLAPYLAEMFADFLMDKGPIWPEVDIQHYQIDESA
ncbi:MAG: FAD-binding oxidoreductase [Microscillaceae bacterium]|nr:FAD-binding oxidoreductase [Microscillaceae bacterium]